MATAIYTNDLTDPDYARRGLLPSLKLGRHRRFVRSDALDELRRQAD